MFSQSYSFEKQCMSSNDIISSPFILCDSSDLAAFCSKLSFHPIKAGLLSFLQAGGAIFAPPAASLFVVRSSQNLVG